MLSRTDPAGVRPAAAIEPAAPVASAAGARQEALQRLNQIALGQELHASVVSRLDNGSFVVNVSGTLVRMNLPQGAQIGDRLLLTMLAHAPRPTFLLNGEDGSAPATLSAAGRLVGRLAQAALGNDSPPALAARSPLLAAAAALAGPHAGAELAQSLRDALSYSGLFYESHLNDWVNGERPLSALMREPQAAATPIAGLLLASKLLTADGTATDADTALPVLPDALMQGETMQLAPHQLHVLEQQQIRWQGELFPGQPFEWTIQRDAPDSTDDVPERQWQSTVRFELPTLGMVAASIVLRGGRLQIDMRSASGDTVHALRAQGPALAQALADAGSPLSALQIRQDEKT